MSLLASIAFLGAVLEDDDLGAARLGHDGPRHLRALDRWPPNVDVSIIHDEQHPVKYDRVPHLAGKFLDQQAVPRLDPVLFASRLDNRVHVSSSRRAPGGDLYRRRCVWDSTMLAALKKVLLRFEKLF